MKKRSKTFYRYILSYALVLILPVALLFGMSYSYLIDRYSQEISDSNTRLLTQAQEDLDTRLDQLVNIAYMVQNNAVLNLRTNEGDVVAARKATTTLSVLNSVSSLSDFLFTYRSGTDYCFTSSSRITPEKLFGEQLVYSAHTAADFYATVNSPEKVSVWPVDTVRQYGGQETEYLTFFVSYTTGVHTPRQCTVFLIPASRIRSLMSRITEDCGGSVQITDESGNLLLGIGAVSRDKTLQAGKTDDGKLLIDSEPYFLSTVHSETVGWDYTALIPARIVEAPMHRVQRNLVLLLVALTLLGGAAVYYFSYRHYKPLKKLTEKALNSHVPETGAADEMSQVEAVLDALSQESRASRLALEESRTVLLQSGLHRLLAGEYSLALTEELAKHGLTLSPDGQYRVGVLECEKGRLSDLRQTADNWMASLSFERQDAVLCSSLPGEGTFAVLFPAAGVDDGAQEALLSLKSRLEGACGTPVSAGLSLPCPASAIGEAYSQAVQALQFRLVRGSGCLVTYSPDLDASASLQDYPSAQMEQLQWYLLQADAENAGKILHRILGSLQEGQVSFNFARMVCFDVVNMTVRTLNTGRDSRSAPAVQPEMLEQLISFDTVPELLGMLETFVEETCASMQAQPEARDNRAQEMQDYIAENCFDENFSLQAMADFFSLTPSNLSHYFKNCTGQGVLEYVQALRKKEAASLLARTNEPVQIVGERVGMPNVSSFIRFYKQQTGVTPGQYRRQARPSAPPSTDE